MLPPKRRGQRAGILIALFSALATPACRNSLTEIQPAPARFSLAPRDTAVYVGGSYRVRIAAFDSAGNTVSLSPVLSVTGQATVSGTRISASSPGRIRVLAVAGTLRDSVYVSVVPKATLLASRSDGVYVFNTDGSELRKVVSAMNARAGRWLPDGRFFVFSIGLSYAYVSDLGGATRRMIAGSSGLAAELWVHPSRDGQWLYFGGYDAAQFRGYPYRVRPDGSGLSLIPGFTADGFTQGHPSVSPQGDRVAYFREEGSSRNVFLRVLDMQSGQLVARDIPGHGPEWSHGDSIAYVDMQGGTSGPLRLMSSSGMGRRQVGVGEAYDFGFDWSPDDRWLVARDLASGRLELIEVATGLRLPLPYSTGFEGPSWRP